MMQFLWRPIRRVCIGVGGMAAAALLALPGGGGAVVCAAPAAQAPVVATTPVPMPAPAPAVNGWTREDAAHLLRRAGFGGSPQQIERLQALGREAAVDYLLEGRVPAGGQAAFEPVKLEAFAFDAEAVEIPPLLKQRIAAQAALKAPGKAGAKVGEGARAKFKEKAAIKRFQSRMEAEAAREWWIDRMLRTDRPLEEKMVLFWHGLLTSGFQEVKNGHFLARQNELYHRFALGNYKKLIHELVRDPAMLKYLNADENVKGKPNENLARELMELFTLGESQGYTERDIQQVARALTGLFPRPEGGFLRPGLHDNGPKDIFGRSGNFGPDEVVDLIFNKPEPARYLARKLWEFYASPDPSEQDLAPVIAALKANGYEVKPALRVLFTSPAFYGEKAKFSLIKSPAELAVETWRALGLEPNEHTARALAKALKDMDQELFQPPNVKGWPGGERWITAATLFTRYNVASAMVNGTLRANRFLGGKKNEGVKSPAKGAGKAGGGGFGLSAGEPASVEALFGDLPGDLTAAPLVDAAIARFLQRPLHPDKRQALIALLGDAPLKLGQPDTDRRVREMVSLLLSTPEYQVH